jgi:tetratricopeptide (TPR) repeat protein
MPDQSNRPLKVFLCHAHPDADKVRALYARLKADGVDAWLDKENIIPGQDWEMEIRKAVRESDIVVVCLSKQFSQKGFRQKEVRIALDEASLQPEGEIFIIPARLEECENPESLGRWHWVDLFDENGYDKLLSALNTRAKKLETVFLEQKDQQLKERQSFVGREMQLKAVQILLLSERSSDNWRAMRQINKWLQENLEDEEVYELLISVVQENDSLIDEVHSILNEMTRKGSRFALEALQIIPVSVQKLTNWADKNYYSADYEEAIKLYRRILSVEPDNQHAQLYINKAKLKKTELDASGLVGNNNILDIPSDAVQYYRRACSYIAAADYSYAYYSLEAAIETAKANGIFYRDAKIKLNIVQQILAVNELREKVHLAINLEQWKEAMEICDKALLLEPYGDLRELRDGLQGLLVAYAWLSTLTNPQFKDVEVIEKFRKVAVSLDVAEQDKILVNTFLFRRVREMRNKFQKGHKTSKKNRSS